jgi:hypothetical protein
VEKDRKIAGRPVREIKKFFSLRCEKRRISLKIMRIMDWLNGRI